MQTNLVSVTILSHKKKLTLTYILPIYSTDLVKARKFSSLREPSEALYPFKER